MCGVLLHDCGVRTTGPMAENVFFLLARLKAKSETKSRTGFGCLCLLVSFCKVFNRRTQRQPNVAGDKKNSTALLRTDALLGGVVYSDSA